MNRRIRKRRALIVDLDETVLDNSRYRGEIVKNTFPFVEAFIARARREGGIR